MQICGFENFATANGSETRQLVAAHLEALRATHCFAKSRIILVPEANLGNEAQEISEHVLDMAGVTVLCQRSDRYGVYTSHETKQMYVFRFGDLLSHGAVRYHDTLVSANPFLTKNKPAEKVTLAKKELERQLRSFRRVSIMPKSLNSRVSVSYSGKVDKDNQRTNRLRDDLCMALIFGVYWSGQHKNALISERGYQGRFLRPDGMPIAPVFRPPETATHTILMQPPKRRRLADDTTVSVSEMESYADTQRKRTRA